MKSAHLKLAVPCVALCVLGAATPVSAWRTAAELPEVAGARFMGWTGPVVAVELYSERVPVPARDLEAALGHAISQWTDVACSDITLLYGGTTLNAPRAGDGRNTIAWLDTEWAIRGYPTATAGITDVEYAMGADGAWFIREADIYLNSEFVWSGMGGGADPRGRDVASVLTHEFGHLLGLLHPCGFESGAASCTDDAYSVTTMYPEYTGPAQGTLDVDDIDGFCSIYATTPNLCEVTCGADSLCVDGECRGRCGAELCKADEVCVSNACIRAALVCEADADCDVGEICQAGMCATSRAEVPDGFPCDGDGECASGRCSREHYCAQPCTAACTCDRAGDTCEISGAFGASCERGEDCLERVCLIDTNTSYCTAQCRPRTCPSGYACEVIGELFACRRAVPPPSGCSTSAVRPLAASGTPSFALLLVSICLFRHRRTRAKRSSCQTIA